MNRDGQQPENEAKEAWRPSWRLTTAMRDLVDEWAASRGIAANQAATELLTLAEGLSRKGVIDPRTGQVTLPAGPRRGEDASTVAPGGPDTEAFGALLREHKEALDIARVGRLAELVSGLEKFNALSQRLLEDSMKNVSDSASGIERACRDFTAVQKGAEEARESLGKMTSEVGEVVRRSAGDLTQKLQEILENQLRIEAGSKAAIEERRRLSNEILRGHEKAMEDNLTLTGKFIAESADQHSRVIEESRALLEAVDMRRKAIEDDEARAKRTVSLFQTKALATVIVVSVFIHAGGLLYTGVIAPEVKAAHAEDIAAKAIAEHSAVMAKKFDEHFEAVRAAQDQKLQKYFSEEADRLAAFQKENRKDLAKLRIKLTDTENIAQSWYDRAQRLEAEKKSKGICGVVGAGGGGLGSGWLTLGLLLLPVLAPIARFFKRGRP